MICTTAVFENFRNIEHQPLSFEKGINILYGKNAQGKTNIIEGLYLFAVGKSFRGARDKDLVNFGKLFSQVSMTYEDGKRENRLTVKFFPEKRREMMKNGVDIRKSSEFLGNFRAVLFCPDHLEIVKDAPSFRRSFTDIALSQVKARYLAELIDYNKILAQRNFLIKNADQNPVDYNATIDIWSERLAVSAAYITVCRANYYKELFQSVDNFFTDMTVGKEKISYIYQSSAIKDQDALFDEMYCRDEYRRMLTQYKDREKYAGVTLFGPHKDDLCILLNEKEARLFASQGQQRSISLALKLGEGEISKSVTGEYPVFLLDDVLSELDDDRKKYVLSELKERQVIITACAKDDFSRVKNTSVIRIENGKAHYKDA